MNKWIQRIALIVWISFLPGGGDAQELEWKRIVQRRYPDTVCAVMSQGTDRFTVAGTSAFFGGLQFHPFLMTFDGSGKQIRQQVFHVGEVDRTRDAVQVPGMGFYLVGTTWAGSSPTAAVMLIRADPSGNEIWKTTLDTPANENGNALCAVGKRGIVIAAVRQFPPPHGKDVRLIRIDASGSVLWENRCKKKGDDIPWSIIPSDDGGFIVSGETGASAGRPGNAFVMKTDATGQQEWTQVWAEDESSILRSVIACRGGGYIMTGSMRNGDGKYDVMAARIDATGKPVWRRRHGGKFSDHGWCIRETPNGDFLIAGNTWSRGHQGSSDLMLMRIDKSGRLLWTRRWGGTEFDAGYALTNLPGGWVVAGKTKTHGDGDLFLLRVEE